MDSPGDVLYVLYRAEPTAEPTSPRSWPDDLDLRVWQPSWLRPFPPGLRLPRFLVWWLFDRLHVFNGHEYQVLLGIDRAGHVIHRSCVFPAWFRFPFMAPEDLQIGDIYTEPSRRNSGIATVALISLVRALARPGRQILYVVAADNLASRRAASRAGFVEAGFVRRHARGLACRYRKQPLASS